MAKKASVRHLGLGANRYRLKAVTRQQYPHFARPKKQGRVHGSEATAVEEAVSHEEVCRD